MKKYGIELEFFLLEKGGYITPAFKHIENYDGNMVLGEIRTGVFDSLVDCVFDLKRKIYLQIKELAKKNLEIFLAPFVSVNEDFIRMLRRDKTYNERKILTQTDESSIYDEVAKTNILKIEEYKASLQISISENSVLRYTEAKIAKELNYSTIFDYNSIIRKLDNTFDSEIEETKRTKGIYSIKGGQFGKRIEYRSLPNNISLDKLLEIDI